MPAGRFFAASGLPFWAAAIVGIIASGLVGVVVGAIVGRADLFAAHNIQVVIIAAMYDALVGMTANELGATLYTLDRRAIKTYDLLGVDYQLISPS